MLQNNNINIKYLGVPKGRAFTTRFLVKKPKELKHAVLSLTQKTNTKIKY